MRYYGAPSKVKYLCVDCGWAAKGQCPQQGHRSVSMGKNWRPGLGTTLRSRWPNGFSAHLVIRDEAAYFSREVEDHVPVHNV